MPDLCKLYCRRLTERNTAIASICLVCQWKEKENPQTCRAVAHRSADY